MLELLLELRQPALVALDLGRLLVELGRRLMVAADLGSVGGLGLGGALVAATFLVRHAAQLALATAQLVGQLLHLALDVAQLAGLLLGLGEGAAHLVQIQLHGLQLPAQAIDQTFALTQRGVARRVGVDGYDRPAVGPPASPVGPLIAERADLEKALRGRILVEARRLPHQKVASAERAARGVLGSARQFRPPLQKRTSEHTGPWQDDGSRPSKVLQVQH